MFALALLLSLKINVKANNNIFICTFKSKFQIWKYNTINHIKKHIIHSIYCNYYKKPANFINMVLLKSGENEQFCFE